MRCRVAPIKRPIGNTSRRPRQPSEPMSPRKKIATETRVISVMLPMMINIAEVARPLAGAVAVADI